MQISICLVKNLKKAPYNRLTFFIFIFLFLFASAKQVPKKYVFYNKAISDPSLQTLK